MPPLVIVIPTYNEADNLPALAHAIWSQPLPETHLLIVDDGSPDGTGEVAEELGRQNPGRLAVIHRPAKLGLGSAYITGFRSALASGAEAIGQMDADFSHAPAYLPALLDMLELCDVVVGSRYVPGGSVDRRWGVGRKLLSAFGNAYARTILGMKVRDATGGYRVWRRETLLGMPLDRIRSNGYIFQVEMAYVAQRLGYEAAETPIYFEDRRIGQSKMSLQIQVEAAFRVWQVRWAHHRLTPVDRQPGG